ncbi:MAG TPA: GNAT family N-acetyltransferase [Candidatus Babeliales bacterium]|nr:GNAT family N-acetyltransferase [Candidatus Babeliales bacterium]
MKSWHYTLLLIGMSFFCCLTKSETVNSEHYITTKYNFFCLWKKIGWPTARVGNADFFLGPIKCGYFNAAWNIRTHDEFKSAQDFFNGNRFYIQHLPDQLNVDICPWFKDPVTRLEMILDIPSFTFQKDSEEFSIRAVSNEEELNDFAQLFAPGFSLSMEEALISLKPMSAVSTFFVAYHKDEPVGRAQLFIDDHDTAGIWMVFVKENFRKKGIGRALTQKCLRHAKDCGATIAVLNATPNAESLYLKMGFKARQLWHLEIMR